jgi:hypothetical protein
MMKSLTTLSLALVSIGALAMPHASLSQSVLQRNAGGDQTKASDGFAGLMQNVNLILQQEMTTWSDPRGPITQKAAELGLSAADVMRIRETVGYVICPGNNGVGAVSGTGMLIGFGGVVVTDAHIFIDPETNQRKEPLSDCVFINQLDYKPVKLDFSSDRTYKFYTNSPKREWYNDRAIVRLKSRANVQPFQLDSFNTLLKPGDKIIMISAVQQRLTFPLQQRAVNFTLHNGVTVSTNIYSEPLVQSCSVKLYYPPKTAASSAVYTDCNGTEGASGSVMTVRLAGGQTVAKALLEQGGGSDSDYKPFKVGDGVPDPELSYSLGVGLDPQVASDVLEMERLR